jgi:hypothetical protein
MRLAACLLLSACGSTPGALPGRAATPIVADLAVPELHPAETFVLLAAGFAPGERVFFLASTDGLGPGPCIPIGCLDLADAFVVGHARVDDRGIASFARTLPANTPLGESFWMQAASPTSGMTAPVHRVVGGPRPHEGPALASWATGVLLADDTAAPRP